MLRYAPPSERAPCVLVRLDYGYIAEHLGGFAALGKAIFPSAYSPSRFAARMRSYWLHTGKAALNISLTDARIG